MHRLTIQTAAIATLAGLLLGGCLGDYTVTPGPDPDCPKPPPAEDQPPANDIDIYGTRLAPVWTLFDDGTRVREFGTFYDHLRGERCSVVHVKDQPSRCLPAFVWNSKPGKFTDAACSAAVVVVDNCAALPKYVRDESAKPWDVCAPHPLDVIYELGAALPPAALLYHVNPLGNCVQADPIDPKNVAMPIGNPVPLDEFAAVITIEPAGP